MGGQSGAAAAHVDDGNHTVRRKVLRAQVRVLECVALCPVPPLTLEIVLSTSWLTLAFRLGKIHGMDARYRDYVDE